MKKISTLFLVFLLPLFTFSNGFIINGTIDGLQSGSVSMSFHNASGDDTTISASIEAGKFTLTAAVLEPELVRLTVADGNVSFFLENAIISISMVKDSPEKTKITGSASNATYERLKPGLSDFFEYARQNQGAHLVASMAHNHIGLAEADSLWAVRQGQWIQSIRATITADRNNYAALYFIQWLLFRPDHMDTIRSLFMHLGPHVRQGAAGQKFIHDFEHLYRKSSGQPAPDISGNDTSGHSVTLASARGSVILLDFWASYCGPCRQENTKLKSFYQQYHPAGFEIISFSLDNDRPLWLHAIQADGLIWPQASDLRGGAGSTAAVYDITELPRNVLIDRSGKIYGRDLHDEDLKEAVQRLLAKNK
jgi:thiol-disulfide isomerase/thioredoxin